MADIQLGTTGSSDRVVTRDLTTQRGDLHIFSTPNVVKFLEETAIEVLHPSLPAGSDSVGTTIDIAHVAPTLEGQTATCTATVVEVDRRRVVFEIEVRDELDVIATGRHERFVVDLEKFTPKLEEKRDRVAQERT